MLECFIQNVNMNYQVIPTLCIKKIECECLRVKIIRLNSSTPPFLLQKCLPPNTTVIGRPILSKPCMNILFCAISFGTSDGEIDPFGVNVFLHFRYLRNMAQALSTSRSRARRNLLSVWSSYSWNTTRVSKFRHWNWLRM